jgi:UDP-N-acetylmuramyl-tripeptide synthetase
VLWEDAVPFMWQSNWPIPQLAVQNLKQKAGEIAAEFYGYPSQHLNVIGVTGTNGKTSVTQWLRQCLSQLGKKTAVIGTVGNTIFNSTVTNNSVCEKPLSFTENTFATSNTTPDAIVLQSLLADYRANKVNTVVMEVSSHGLDQGRVNGVAFDIAVFTNLTRDHLDYHGDMASYAAAKRKLFDWPSLRTAIVNIDDAFGKELADALKANHKPCITYGFANADVTARDLALTQNGLRMKVNTPQGEIEITAPVIGRFNADNVLAVLSTMLVLDITLGDAAKAIANITSVAGRMQQIGGGNLPLVVVDYAHTPDALEKILSTLKAQLEVNTKLICVFGCGGNRDPGKRPIMGKIASQIVDVVVLTNDNPRYENPAEILKAIQAGFPTNFKQYQVFPDRMEAITAAVNLAKVGDIVVIVGKGHEDYQEIAGVKTPFSDIEVAREVLNGFDLSNKKLNGFLKTHAMTKGDLQ